MSDLDKNMAVKSMVVMRKAFRTIDAKVSETFKEFNLTPTQFGVMDVLNAKGRMKIGELIDRMLATSGNMTVVIKNMEKKGWLTREACQTEWKTEMQQTVSQAMQEAVLWNPAPGQNHTPLPYL